jgi:dTMP kinase
VDSGPRPAGVVRAPRYPGGVSESPAQPSDALQSDIGGDPGTAGRAPEGGDASYDAAADVRPVLRIPAFRRLWTALALSSFGDWLGLLALTSLATQLAGGSYAQANLAIAGVFILRLAPAVFFGPFAGVVADRLDRRWTMVTCDIARGLLFISIPIVGSLWWLLAATFLIEVAAMFWIPAKEATVPNLVPRSRLESANQISLMATYGSAPVAALVFAALSLLTGMLDNVVGALEANPVDLALLVNAVTFLFSALTIWRLRDIPSASLTQAEGERPTVWRTITEGWRFLLVTPVVRGLVVGMLGAFAAGGAVVGLARTYVGDLGGGDPGYGVLFGAVFLGMAAGLALGPRLFAQFSRRRLFGLSIVGAGMSLSLLALVPNLVMAALFTISLGAWAGVAWVTGYTLLGLEVSDELRGRTFAFVQTMVRITLIAVLAIAPLVAAGIGRHSIEFTESRSLTYNGAAITYFVAAVLAIALGVASFRQMDDRRGVPLLADLKAAVRGETMELPLPSSVTTSPGFFLVLEGGEGAGKSTQLSMLADWLTAKGHEVVLTREPGATPLGERLRELLLDPATEGLSPRAEALLYAADRAQHVDTVIRPALERGAIVVSDRYVDSSVAYQGAGRSLAPAEVTRISSWATGGLVPNLTVVLDVDPAVGLERSGGPADRLEAEPMEFHRRVREAFLSAAAHTPKRYLVVDASFPVEEVSARLRERLEDAIPLSERERQEAEEEARRRAEEEALRRAEEEARRRAEEEARRRAEEEARRRAEEEARRRAEEEARRREEEARRRAEEEARRRAEEEARRQAEEEARRQAEELARRQAQEQARLRAEVEGREAAAAEVRRLAAEVEAQRLAAREEARRVAEAEVRRRSDSEETRRRAEAAEAARRAAEAQAARREREASSARAPEQADPPTREFSLADEILSLGSDDDTIEFRRDGR